MSLRSLEKAYDEISGGGDGLDAAIVDREIDELVTAASEVEKVRHTVYAHRAAAGPALDAIGLGTIHALIDVEERLAKKYISVLFFESTIQLTPIDLTDWERVLTFAWSAQRGARNTSVPYAATPELVSTLFRALNSEERKVVRKSMLEES